MDNPSVRSRFTPREVVDVDDVEVVSEESEEVEVKPRKRTKK